MVRVNTIKTVLFLLVMSASINSFSQFTGGGRVGVNFANMRGESVQNNKMLIGYNIGGYLNYGMNDLYSGKWSKILSIQTGLSLQTKGTIADFKTIDSTLLLTTESAIKTESDVKQEFTYLQVPLLAVATFGDDRSFLYYGEAGFFLSALTGVKIDGKKSRDHDSDKSTDTRKYRDEYSGFDAGVIIGGGVKIPFGGRKSPWSAYGNVRYTLGLKNIGIPREKAVDIPEEQVDDIKTNTFSLLFGVAYKF